MFKWSKEFEVDNEDINEQHKNLFELGNDIFKSNYKDCKPLVMAMFKYARIHFMLEEEYMKEINFAGLEDHKKVHALMIHKLNKVTENQITNKFEFEEVQKLIWVWITQHIMKKDKEYMIKKEK